MTLTDNDGVPASEKSFEKHDEDNVGNTSGASEMNGPKDSDAGTGEDSRTKDHNDSEDHEAAPEVTNAVQQESKWISDNYEVQRIMRKDRKMPQFYSLEPPNSAIGNPAVSLPPPVILPTDSIHTTGPALSTRVVSLDGPIHDDPRIVCPKVRTHLLDLSTGTYYDIRHIIHPSEYPPMDPDTPESEYFSTFWGDFITRVPPLPQPRQGLHFETFPALNPSLRTHARLLHEAGMYSAIPSHSSQSDSERCSLVFGDTFVFPVTTLEILQNPSAVLVFELIEHAVEDNRDEIALGWGYLRLSSILGTPHFPSDLHIPLGFPEGFTPSAYTSSSVSSPSSAIEENIYPVSVPLFEVPKIPPRQLKAHIVESIQRHQQLNSNKTSRPNTSPSDSLVPEKLASIPKYARFLEYTRTTISRTSRQPLPAQPPTASLYFRAPNPVPTPYALRVLVFGSLIPKFRVVKTTERGAVHTIPRIKGPDIVQPANRTALAVHPVLHRPPHLLALPTDLPAHELRLETPTESDDGKGDPKEDLDKASEHANLDYESDEDESLLFSKLPQPALRPSRNRRYMDPCRVPTILLGTLPTEKQGASAISFSPDGTLLAVAACMERGAGIGEGFPIRIFAVGPDVPDVYCGRLLAALEGHTGLVYSLQWSPDSTYLLSAAADGTTYLWHLPRTRNGWMIRTTSRPVSRLAHIPLTYVYSAKFVPFALQYIVTASYFGGVRLWHIPDSCFEHPPQQRHSIGVTYPLSIDASVHDVPLATCLGTLESEINALGETYHGYAEHMRETGGHLGRSLLGATGNFLWFPTPEHEDSVSFTARSGGAHDALANPSQAPYINCIEFDTACYDDGGTRCLVAGDSHGQIQVWICPDPNVDFDDGVGFSETRARYHRENVSIDKGDAIIQIDPDNSANDHTNDALELTPESFLCHKACLIAEDSPILDICARPALGCKGHPQVLLLIQGQPLLLFDLETFALLRHFTVSPPPSTRVGATWSPDGVFIASGHQDGVLRMWNGHDGSPIPVQVNARKEKHQELQRRAMGRAHRSDGAPVGYPISLLQVAWNEQAHQVAVIGFGSGYPVLVVS